MILVGILVSYLPQHIKIIARRSSEGISPYFVLLGTTSATAAFANVVVLPTTRADMACCKHISGFECFAGVLGVMQLGMQWTCFTVIMFLFLIFFPREKSMETPTGQPAPSYRVALGVMVVSVVHAFITAIMSAIIVYVYPGSSQRYAEVMGVIATVLSAIQYFPQLRETWRLKTVGSLSIPMMCIQTPGAFLWAGSLAARSGWEGWSLWSIYLVAGVLQGILLAMAITFELRIRSQRKASTAENDSIAEDSPTRADASEETPLLRN